MENKQWNISALILTHVAIILLYLSWVIFPSSFFWQLLDHKTFVFTNSLLANAKAQAFWAYANSRAMDWWHDLVMVSFFVIYIFQAEREDRVRRLGHFLFTVALFGFTIVIVNKYLIHNHFKILRDSPSLIYPGCNRLSLLVDWMRVKDYSRCSFPSDHGTTATLFAGSCIILMGKRAGLLATLYAIFLSLPRMIAGAHWLSDILIGSMTITLIMLSWAFFTPLCALFTDVVTKIFRGKRKLSYEPRDI